MNIWVHENALTEMKLLEYIKFPATFHVTMGVSPRKIDYKKYDGFIYSTKEFQPNDALFLLENNYKVFLLCIHGDGFHLENRKEFLKYDNFKIITSAIDGGTQGQILDYPNTYLNVSLSLMYYYVLFAVELFEFQKIVSDKKYKCGVWYREGYRNDRDFLLKEIRQSNYVDIFKIIEQKNSETFKLLIGPNITDSYKQWSVQFFNFMDCEMFLSFESSNTDAIAFFCSDKILKGFIMESLGIPTIHILQHRIKSELEKDGFDIIGYTSYESKIVKEISDLNTIELKERNIKSNNLKRLEDMIHNGHILNELKKIML